MDIHKQFRKARLSLACLTSICWSMSLIAATTNFTLTADSYYNSFTFSGDVSTVQGLGPTWTDVDPDKAESILLRYDSAPVGNELWLLAAAQRGVNHIGTFGLPTAYKDVDPDDLDYVTTPDNVLSQLAYDGGLVAEQSTLTGGVKCVQSGAGAPQVRVFLQTGLTNDYVSWSSPTVITAPQYEMLVDAWRGEEQTLCEYKLLGSGAETETFTLTVEMYRTCTVDGAFPTNANNSCEIMAGGEADCPFSCNIGFEGGGTISCGLLGGEPIVEGSCIPIPTCDVPDEFPTNATNSCGVMNGGDPDCAFTCNNGFEPDGLATISCPAAGGAPQVNGSCSAKPPGRNDVLPGEVFFSPQTAMGLILSLATSSSPTPITARYAGAGVGMSGPSGDFRVGNSGYVPAGGGLIGIGYDRGNNDSRNQFNGHADRIHLDYVQRFGQFFAGIAGVYRQSKYTLDSNDTWETKYYGPRIDFGWITDQGGSGKDAINPDYAYVQLSGGYLWGKGKLDGVNGDRGYLIPSSFIVGASKRFTPRLALLPEANLQWMWQNLGTIDTLSFKNRSYGRADFNLGVEAFLPRGWFITPNAGYRWDIRAVCTQNTTAGVAKTCVPKASGLRYGLNLGKDSTASSNFINQLALSAYYDYFKKSGVKQTQWGVMAQYPF